MILRLKDGRRVGVNEPGHVRLRGAAGTIHVTVRGDVREILFEELLAIELRPRAAVPAVVPHHEGPTA